MLDSFNTLSILVGLFVFIHGLRAYIDARKSPLNTIPALGYSGVLTSYITALQSIFNLKTMVQEALPKFNGSPFRVPMIQKWMVVVSTPQLIDEFRKAPDDVLSFHEAAAESLQIEHTMGPEVRRNQYHELSIRTPLTRNLAARFPDLYDEIKLAFSEFIPLTESWSPIPAYDTAMHIVSRSSNRVFVGLPFCRDPDYCKLNEEFTLQVVISGTILMWLPEFLRPLAARFLTKVESGIQRGIRHLGPMIKERLEQEEKYGKEWAERPNDLVSWLLDYAQPHQREERELVIRILVVNFAAIHTTTMAFTHALYDIASRPEYVESLREEIQKIVDEEGWTKAAMGKMRKLDSFIRESQRVSGSGAVTMTRKALKDFTFSDGTTVPAGHFVAVCSIAIHNNPDHYEDPYSFRGFRYSDIRQQEGESLKHQAVTLSPNWLNFGAGRHACPGRFMAISEIKALLAHTLLNYDVKTVDGARPKNVSLGPTDMPNPKAKILFRKRALV
ncbi:hypothetical protein AX16_010766 [Volvariella volvacea WC 439]|nr:hypothetical protein AX16_010766 [Volvariella volvacea WC 439]